MKVVVVYKDNSDHARAVYNFLRDYEIRIGRKLDTVDPDTRDGADFCRLYDVMVSPVRDNCGIININYKGGV